MTMISTAVRLAAQTEDAYSFDNYAPGEWQRCAYELLVRGYTDVEVEAILRSKWTRWAHDCSNSPYGETTAEDLLAFMADKRNNCTPAAVADLVRWTQELLA